MKSQEGHIYDLDIVVNVYIFVYFLSFIIIIIILCNIQLPMLWFTQVNTI